MPKFRQNKWFSFNQLRISLGFGGLTRVWDGTGLKALFHATLFTGLKASASTRRCFAPLPVGLVKTFPFPPFASQRMGHPFFSLVLQVKTSVAPTQDDIR